VLEHAELTVRFEHAPHFCETARRLADAAEHQPAQHRVELPSRNGSSSARAAPSGTGARAGARA
jgi:hypothetical protein